MTTSCWPRCGSVEVLTHVTAPGMGDCSNIFTSQLNSENET